MSETQSGKIKALSDLLDHDGWAVVKEYMLKEIRTSEVIVSRDRNIDQRELDFRQGTIFAADSMLDLPTKLIKLFQDELALESGKVSENNDIRKEEGITPNTH